MSTFASNEKLYNACFGLVRACSGGHEDLALLMIEKGANNWDEGLIHACYRGHKDLVLLMIKKGATDWNVGLEYACQGSAMYACQEVYKDLAVLMIELGADISECNIALGNETVEYLVRSKIKNASKTYPDIHKYCVQANNIVRNSGVMIKDLLSIVELY